MKFNEVAAAHIHDVKNQLFALSARAEAQGDGEMVLGLHKAATTLTQLLTLYKRERGEHRLDIRDGSPADLIEELAAGARPFTPLTIETDTGQAPPFWFYDEALVRLALHDALHNAIRHARSRVCLTAREVVDRLIFEVRDDGPGYPQAILEGSPAGPGHIVGTGLGLALARDIAAAHEHDGRRGELRLANQGGAVFALSLPR